MKRNRLIYLIALIGVIALGLVSRRFPNLLPAALGKYPGDALWAMMVFLGLGLLLRGASTWHVAAISFLFSCLIEFSQLYQSDWINSVRATTAGHLVLGSGFAWNDIAAYAIGISIATAIEFVLLKRLESRSC